MLAATRSRTLYTWRAVEPATLSSMLAELDAPEHEIVDPFLDDDTVGVGKLLVSLMQHREPGDDAIRSAAGACAFVRRKRISKRLHGLRERLCARLYDTLSIVGLYRDDAMTEADLELARRLALRIDAVSFDGQAFRDKHDQTIVDVSQPKLEVDEETVMPPEVLACVRPAAEASDGDSKDVSDIAQARIIEKQMHYIMNAKPSSSEATARLRAVRELLEPGYEITLEAWDGRSDDTWKRLQSLASKNQGLLLDGWAAWDPDGRLWVDRDENLAKDARLGSA